MQYYKAKVRLSGSTMNEVEKVLSAPEILVLQYIHGVDAVLNVKPCKNELIKLREEKERLKGLYDKALVKREQSIDTIFGPLGSVPEVLPDDLLEHFDIVDEDDIIAVAKSITKKDKRANHSQTFGNQTEVNRIDRLVPDDEISLSEIMT